MPFGENYDSKYFNIATQFMNGTFNTKAEANKLATRARKAILQARIESTREVTSRWSGRYAEIKAENDAAQLAIKKAYESAYMEINAMLMDMYEGLQG